MPSGFFALLDDIALLMDDVAAMTKVAGKKTAGILGDDLAVNAEKAVGFSSARELPVLGHHPRFVSEQGHHFAFGVWAECMGSLGHRAHLDFGRGLPLVRRGGKVGALCAAFPSHHKAEEGPSEQQRIRSAVMVDFILSVEIVILALGQVMEAEMVVQILAVSFIALLATVGSMALWRCWSEWTMLDWP